MQWLNTHTTIIMSILAISSSMSFVLYLALTNKLDERYEKKYCKDDFTRKYDCEQREKTINFMMSSLNKNIDELKKSNENIYRKIDDLVNNFLIKKG